MRTNEMVTTVPVVTTSSLVDDVAETSQATAQVDDVAGNEPAQVIEDAAEQPDDRAGMEDMPTSPPSGTPELPTAPNNGGHCKSEGNETPATVLGSKFAAEETVFIFDWDDTVLPSTWVQCQGLRLNDNSELTAWQREQLAQVANAAAETLRIAKEYGTVVFVTNAERGWIELSCQKFMPTLFPMLKNVKVLSARTTYESPDLASPLDWKLRAFESEIQRIYGPELAGPEKRKNVLSLGDSVHEREALIRATALLPNCCSKSLKFVERPDIGHLCKQHSLVSSYFDTIVHHEGNLDLCIKCV